MWKRSLFGYRRHSSSLIDYNKSILKKFILYTHPDFFANANYKLEKTVNETNLKVILDSNDIDNDTNIHMSKSQSSLSSSSMRSLTFYIKSDNNTDRPRRVKVSLSRKIESIREILETIGIPLPSRPYSSSSSQSSYSIHSDIEFHQFIDSLIERLEL